MIRRAGSAAKLCLALIAATLLAVPVGAVETDGTLVPSPYRFAAKPFQPVARDAKWDQEMCVEAFNYAYQLDDLPEFVADRIAQFDDDHDERRARGASLDEIAAARAEMTKSLADDERAFREEAATNLRNIPRCRGLYLRSALESHCDEHQRTRNQFCALLDGQDMDGVRLTSDTASFRSALAWKYIGAIVDRADAAVVSRWSVSAIEPDTDVLYTHDQIMDRLEADNWSPDDALAQLDNRLRRDASIVMAQSIFVDQKTGARSPNQFGAWALSVELVRGEAENIEPDNFAQVAARARAAGLLPTVGPYLQYPQLHFQVLLYELLLTGRHLTLSVEQADGSLHNLSETAKLAWNPGSVPPFHTHFATDLSHAFMIPSEEDWAMILSPTARQLVIEANIAGPTGTIERIAYPVPLDGIRQALESLHVKLLGFDSEYRESIGLIATNYEEADCGAPPS